MRGKPGAGVAELRARVAALEAEDAALRAQKPWRDLLAQQLHLQQQGSALLL